MQASRAQVLLNVQSMLKVEDQLPHNHCSCEHCINNTKPLRRPIAERITSPKEINIPDTKAYEMVIKQMTKGFSGKAQLPDVFLVAEACMVFQGKNNGRPKMKEKLTHIEAKKHFQEQRKKVNALNSPFLMNTVVSIVEENNQSTFGNKNPPKEKQSSILAYHDGTEQLLTENLLSKYLDKRKNDPIWEPISHIMMIPPELRSPFKTHQHHYIRSNDTLPELEPLIDKLSNEMDLLDERALVQGQSGRIDSKLSFLKVEEQEEMDLSLYMNPQSKLRQSNYRKTKSLIIPKKFTSFVHEQVKAEDIKIACLEIVAFIEIALENRILQADFEFFSQGNKLFLTKIRNFIYQKLDNSDLSLVHDRYKPLEEISLREIALSKHSYDQVEARELDKICAALVKESLEFRKVQLKIKDYKNPSEQVLLKIFAKIFPEFQKQQIFGSINWKNELNTFIVETKTKINKVIREDEGIRILRRFGIEFRRTFH